MFLQPATRTSTDHVNSPTGKTILVFARHLVPIDKLGDVKKMPFLLYLQGGPGFECRFPSSAHGGWIKIAFDKGFQVLLLDQRGTGMSTPVSAGTLSYMFGENDQKKADYLKLFRADSIVRDCEVIREKVTEGRKESEGETKITLLGLSFGGFCVTTYLSLFPNSIKQALITGGIPPPVSHPDSVYRALYPRILQRNRVYYAKYPQDVARVRLILSHLHSHPTALPNGGLLTIRRFLQLGIQFGFVGGHDTVHQVVLHACRDVVSFGKLQYKTLDEVQGLQSWDTNVIYAILHEQVYSQKSGGPTNWSAERVRGEEPWREDFEYRWEEIEKNVTRKESPVNFTGECIYPWMFDDYAELRPLKAVAELLAQYDGWTPLYDIAQLRRNTVPVAGRPARRPGPDRKLPVQAHSWRRGSVMRFNLRLRCLDLLNMCGRSLSNDIQSQGKKRKPSLPPKLQKPMTTYIRHYCKKKDRGLKKSKAIGLASFSCCEINMKEGWLAKWHKIITRIEKHLVETSANPNNTAQGFMANDG
ncbi:Alpha/Beta hydrolase protein [Jimgerdemannia flammicorona]|uniref:Alpha/Beta hydrolase protein n=1 Tax=Jimgerdemannia flammicorona TaxID=994334 RepID=A0A433DH72_9FUNG|nr:Alpha/Beta hydrolase protein [Jimgerdemannia flammicorona]